MPKDTTTPPDPFALPRILAVWPAEDGAAHLEAEGGQLLPLAEYSRAMLAPARPAASSFAALPALLWLDWKDGRQVFQVPPDVYPQLSPFFALTGEVESHTLTEDALALTVRGRVYTFRRPFLYSLARVLDDPAAPRFLTLKRPHDGELLAVVQLPGDSPLCTLLDSWRGGGEA